MKKSTVALLLALVMVFGIAVGGVVAWLTAETQTIKNTFTIGDINITLAETEGADKGNNERSFKIAPGATVDKDPLVTVLANSEDCYLFVKVDEVDNANILEWTIAEGWTQLKVDGEAVTGVYYRVVTASDADQEFGVLLNDQVTIANTVEDGANLPTLSFTAYAIQKDNIADEATAWAALNP